jgi:double-stranded uracil-DNA glycosylase
MRAAGLEADAPLNPERAGNLTIATRPLRSVLPDLLAPELDVVFCGTAAGSRSAALGAYYAGRGDRLRPDEFRSLLAYKIGLTDLAKRTSGADASIGCEHFDLAGTIARLRPLQPWVVATARRRPRSGSI